MFTPLQSAHDVKKQILHLCTQGPKILKDFVNELQMTQADALGHLASMVNNGFLTKTFEKRRTLVELGGGEYVVTVYSLTMLGRRHASG